MLSKINSCGLLGIDGYVIEVETDISNGIPTFEIVGLADTAVRESKERVRAAVRNSGLEFPVRRITVNLAPASTRKEGSAFDLPIALGILAATGQVSNRSLSEYMFVGELSLDGEVKPVNGILPVAVCAMYEGVKNLVLPAENAFEAAVVKDINVFPARSLSDIVSHLNGEMLMKKCDVDIEGILKGNTESELDFADVCGQESVKRALEVAASGGHNILMIGSPGAGKSMIAKRIPTILPAITFEEALEVTKIHSIAGLLPPRTSLVTSRPFRSPHHTISAVGLVGGGKIPKPGEVSLAHFGVLFLDELPEFGKAALEVLRQPLEDGQVTISRANSSFTYPARTTLVCAANPCPCGNYLDPSRNCTCTPRQVQQYLGKLSGPLLDRLDIHIEVYSVKFGELERKAEAEASSVMRERVNRARKIQVERYRGKKIYSNSELLPSMINKYCRLDEKGRELSKNSD